MENDSSRKNAERTVGETTFIHPAAIVDSGAKVGSRTRVWPFSHILAGAEVGDDCNICEGVFIETGRSLVIESQLSQGFNYGMGFDYLMTFLSGPMQPLLMISIQEVRNIQNLF